MADSWLGKVKGHVGEAKDRFSADKKQREEAEKSPKSIILTKQEVQGEWDANRVLMTTIGGGSRRITSDDLATFRHNMRMAQSRFKGGKGITARQVIDMASSQPLSYVSANPNEASSDIDKARKEITSGIPVSAHNGMVRFITNAGKDSDVTRHHVVVMFNAFDEAGHKLAAQITTVSTTVGGNTADISELFTSVNGLGVQWAIQGYVGGSYGGLVFTGVKKADGTGASFLLEIQSNVIINGDLLVTGTVYNEKLNNSAVSRAWVAEGGASASITPNFRGTGFLEIYAQFKGDGNAYSAIDQFVLRVREDGNILADTPINHAQNGTGSGAASRYGATSIVYIRTPSTGNHTYSVEIVKVIAVTGITLSGCLIIAKEFSK